MDKDEDILRVPLHMSALPYIEDVCAHAISTKLSRVFLAHQIGVFVVFFQCEIILSISQTRSVPALGKDKKTRTTAQWSHNGRTSIRGVIVMLI